MVIPPKKVTIGGVSLRIVIVPNMVDWGQYHADDKQISISSRALSKHQLFRETLRHEMLHAALEIGGISYLKKYSEEPIVRCIDNIFYPAWDKIRDQLY
jgi:hypothetical protein